MPSNSKIRIQGGTPLAGSVQIQGSKGVLQKLLPATAVFGAEYEFRNFTPTSDGTALLDALQYLGAIVATPDEGLLRIDTRGLKSKPLPSRITTRSNGTFLFAGALLARFGKAELDFPSGDRIGARPLNWHLAALRELGAQVWETASGYKMSSAKLVGVEIHLPAPTVNGTVNTILAAARAHGTTTIVNVALEPEIDDLIRFVEAMGVGISRHPNRRVVVNGTTASKPAVRFTISPDRIDAATFAAAPILAGGCVVLKDAPLSQMQEYFSTLSQLGAALQHTSEGLSIARSGQPSALHMRSGPYPEFASDSGPFVQLLLARAHGRSTFVETVFPDRLGHIRELQRMGAEMTAKTMSQRSSDSSQYTAELGRESMISITGPVELNGTDVTATDTRAAATLILAALAAKGETRIHNAQELDRGYVKLADRLRSLGAQIEYYT